MVLLLVLQTKPEMDIYTRQQQSISREYISVLETNLKASLELIKDIAVDLETSLVQSGDYSPSENKATISTDESMIHLDENYKDLLVEYASIKGVCVLIKGNGLDLIKRSAKSCGND
jgi:hypothetical protein